MGELEWDPAVGWGALPAFSLLPGAKIYLDGFEDDPDWFDDALVRIRSRDTDVFDFIDEGPSLVSKARGRADLVALFAELDDMPDKAALVERLVDRTERVIRARVRTPVSRLTVEEAEALTAAHLSQFVPALPRFERGFGDIPVPEILTWIASQPIRVVTEPGDASPRARPFQLTVYLRDVRPEDRPLFPFTEGQFSYVDDLLEECLVNYWWEGWFPIANAFETLNQLFDYSLRPVSRFVMGDDRLAAEDPTYFDPTAYFELWERGASLYLDEDGIEVRTYTASRWLHTCYRE